MQCEGLGKKGEETFMYTAYIQVKTTNYLSVLFGVKHVMMSFWGTEFDERGLV